MQRDANLIIPGISDLDLASKRFTVAVDLGFSRSRKTNGIAFGYPDGSLDTLETKFGDLADVLIDILDNSADQQANIVLEAPLYFTFDSRGNPIGRVKGERKVVGGKTNTRYWYLSGGARVAWSAYFMLNELLAAKLKKKTDIYLYEGFISYKKSGTPHHEDAERLIRALACGRAGMVVDGKTQDELREPITGAVDRRFILEPSRQVDYGESVPMIIFA